MRTIVTLKVSEFRSTVAPAGRRRVDNRERSDFMDNLSAARQETAMPTATPP